MVRTHGPQGLCNLPDYRERLVANRRPSEIPEHTGATECGRRRTRRDSIDPGHAFWPDSISLADGNKVDAALLSSHGRVTDSDLLALAIANGGQLVAEAVSNGTRALTLI